MAMTPRQVMAGGGRGEAQRGATSVVLVRHPEHPPVLLDAGYGSSTVEPASYPSKFVRRLLDVRLERTIADALPDVGLAPEEVAEVYVTHLHHDHIGGVEDLPHAVIRGDAREWVEAQSGGGLSGYQPEPYLGRAFAPLLFDDGPVGPIPRSGDLFGDGSVLALPAPGHTHGHVMYLVNQPEGSWLFTGDAAWVDGNWVDGPRPKGWASRTLTEVDWKQGVEALAAIRWFADRGVVVVSGHEPANVERFDGWPAPLDWSAASRGEGGP
jgi:glyoxylase-like metal-dependent hydrolase (beta-lactamase superfamily II)